jgi:hypothetical protein
MTAFERNQSVPRRPGDQRLSKVESALSPLSNDFVEWTHDRK